jgi:LuxR family quorum-sensing transcriptional regulator LasR
MKTLERFIALLECPTEQAWQRAIFQLGHAYGFEQTLIAVVPVATASLSDAFLRSNYAEQWRNIYDTQKFANIDPTVAHCIARSTPLIWNPAVFANPQQKEMYEEATSFGLRSGLTLPYHGANGEFGILCFVNDVMPSPRFEGDALRAMPALSMLRDFAFEASLRFAKPSNQPTLPVLTQRELECLKWCAAGKSAWETAQILHCSEGAVNFHFGNLRRKFNVSSRQQVLVKAIQFGLLRL